MGSIEGTKASEPRAHTPAYMEANGSSALKSLLLLDSRKSQHTSTEAKKEMSNKSSHTSKLPFTRVNFNAGRPKSPLLPLPPLLSPTLPPIVEDELVRLLKRAAKKAREHPVLSNTEARYGISHQQSGIRPIPLNVQQQTLVRAEQHRASMLKARKDNIVVSYTISEDRSGNRGNRILSRFGEKKCGSQEVSLKAISSYTSRLGLRDRRRVSAKNVEEHVEQIDLDAEPTPPPSPKVRPTLSTATVKNSNTNRGIVSNTSKGEKTAYPSDQKKSTIPLGHRERGMIDYDLVDDSESSSLSSVPPSPSDFVWDSSKSPSTHSQIDMEAMNRTSTLSRDPILAVPAIMRPYSNPTDPDILKGMSLHTKRKNDYQSGSNLSLKSQEIKTRGRRESHEGGEAQGAPLKRRKPYNHVAAEHRPMMQIDAASAFLLDRRNSSHSFIGPQYDATRSSFTKASTRKDPVAVFERARQAALTRGSDNKSPNAPASYAFYQ